MKQYRYEGGDEMCYLAEGDICERLGNSEYEGCGVYRVIGSSNYTQDVNDEFMEEIKDGSR